MLKVTVEGIYESDTGSGQKKYGNFNYTFELSREREEGIETHVLRRFIPYLIAKDKGKLQIPFSRIKSFLISTVEKNDKKSTLFEKDILSLDDWEIQDLACLFDLYEIPVYGKLPIALLREKAAEAYMKKILKVPVRTAQDKAQLSFYKQLADGTFKLDFGNEKLPVIIPQKYFEKEEEKKKEKISLSYFLKTSIISGEGEVIDGEQEEAGSTGQKEERHNGLFPNLTQIIKQGADK